MFLYLYWIEYNNKGGEWYDERYVRRHVSRAAGTASEPEESLGEGYEPVHRAESGQPAQLRPFVDKVKKLSLTQFASIEAVVEEYLKL